MRTIPDEYFVKDYYAELGLGPGSSAADIKKQYRKLALKYHPDKNSDPSATMRFQAVSEAYKVLSDDAERKRYDDASPYGNKSRFLDPEPRRSPQPTSFQPKPQPESEPEPAPAQYQSQPQSQSDFSWASFWQPMTQLAAITVSVTTIATTLMSTVIHKNVSRSRIGLSFFSLFVLWQNKEDLKDLMRNDSSSSGYTPSA